MRVHLLALFTLTLLLVCLDLSEGQSRPQQSAARPNSSERSWIDRLLPARPANNSSAVGSQPTEESKRVVVTATDGNGDSSSSSNNNNNSNGAAENNDDDIGDTNDDQDAADDDDQDELDDLDDDEEAAGSTSRASQAKMLEDFFGNQLKLQDNRTLVLSPSKGRDLGLLTIKAILLGPLIGLTIKAALIRGILWALGAYVLHLFFPGLLGALGLGTGLVGFARQMNQPNYAQMFVPHLMNGIQNSLPKTLARMANQYRQVYQPVVESIQSIPEGHCRLRAVCETGSYLIRNSQRLSTSLQRISATVYLNFGTDYSKAWLDGIVQSDCAARYAQCESSPFSMIAARLAEALKAPRMAAEAAAAAASSGGQSSTPM